jgi:hypothetical protein
MPAATTPRSSVPGSGGPVAAPASMTDTVTGFGVGHELVWDVDGRRWIVPTFTVSTASNMLFTVFAIEADMVRIVDAPVGDRDHVDLSGRGAPELAPPESPAPAAPTPTLAAPPVATSTTSVSPPFDNAPAPPLTTTIPGTTAVVPCAGTPPSDASVMTVPPALPGPVDGRTREEWGASAVSVISPLMVGLPTSDAVVVLEQACWTVRISSPGGPTTTITPDLRWDRIVLVDDGNGRVAAVVFE